MGASSKIVADLTGKAEPPLQPGRAVFLDRDGVLNQVFVRDNTSYPPMTLEQVELLAGAREATNRLHQMGFRLLVVTNQPDVARGRQAKERVEEINAYLREQLNLDAIYTCYHDTKDGCSCRKPRPGLLFQAAQEWPIALEKSFMVGDRYNDVKAGHAAGCTTILFDQGHAGKPIIEPDYRVSSLAEVVNIISGLIQKED